MILYYDCSRKKRFGTVSKTVHTKKIRLSNGTHLKCKWLNCPSQLKEYKTNKPTGICKAVLLNNTIQVRYCFCG